MRKGRNMEAWAAGILISGIFVIAIYDTVASYRPNGGPTITMVIREWSARWPILPLTIGIIIGHLFWPPGVTLRVETEPVKVVSPIPDVRDDHD